MHYPCLSDLTANVNLKNIDLLLFVTEIIGVNICQNNLISYHSFSTCSTQQLLANVVNNMGQRLPF